VSEDQRRVCGSEVQIFTVSLNGANILSTLIHSPLFALRHESIRDPVGGMIQVQQNDWNTRLPILSGRKYPFLQVFP